MKRLVVIFFCLLFMNGASGVEADIVELVTVIVGDSVSLHTYVSQIQLGSVILWTLGEEVIGRINSESSKTTHKIYRERLELNSQSGNLRIRNVKITDSGFYKLEINSPSGRWSNTFNVSVTDTASDGVKVMSVQERDSVILPTGLVKLQRDDQLTWKFEDTLIAHINQTGIFPHTVLNGIFQDRLHLNPWTGSLTITNVRSNTSGLYVLDISKSSSRYTTHKAFNVTTTDGYNRLSVMEGSSVTLESSVPAISNGTVIMWRCEHGDSVIAKISNGNSTTFDGADGRFRDMLELNYKTGSLTIRNIRMNHAGLYHLDIIGKRHTIFKRISISVCPQVWPLYIIAAIAVAFLLLAMAGVVLICYQNKVSSQTVNASGVI